jgi:predicted kinase
MGQLVLILKGLPASGKSTYARMQLEDHPGIYKRVNKDDLRKMLDAGHWNKENEEFVLRLRDDLILKALNAGKSVIVDDTNLHPKHEADIRALVDEYNYALDSAHGVTLERAVEVEVKMFDTPLEDCVKRDAARAEAVGAKVIRRMHRQFLQENIAPSAIEHDPKLPNAIICDMDGTLALHNGRSPYETEKCGDDLVNTPVASIVMKMVSGWDDAQVLIVSGRDDTYIGHTMQWLSRNYIPYDEIWMRRAGDRRDDVVAKKEIYEQHIKGKYNVLFVLDDRQRVVDMWRSLGLTVLQVAEGNY